MAAAPRVPGALQGIMLLLPITMAVMGISVLTPIVPLLMQRFASAPQHEYLVMGGVITMPAIWVLIFSPGAGWLADRLGRRNLLVASMVIYAAVGVAPAFLDDLYAIIGSRIAVGICESIVMTVSTTLISDYFQGRARERWLAGQTAVASLSALGIIYLGGQLGAAYGWRGPFFLYAYSLPLALGVWLTTWEPASGAVSAQAEPAARFASVPWARLAGICGITVLASIAFYTVITKNAQALNALGVSDPAEIAKLTMLSSIGVPLGTFLFWGLSRLPVGWLLCVDFALVGIGFACMGHAPDASGYALRTFINQVGCGLMLPTLLVWATRGVAYSIRGLVNGVWQAAFVVGQFLSGMVVTYLSHAFGGLLPTFITMGCAFGAFAVAAAASNWLGGQKRRQEARAAT